MNLKGDHFWQSGNLINCLEHHTDFSKLNFCLLLLQSNPSALLHLYSLRADIIDPSDLERSKLTEGLLLFSNGQIKQSAEIISSIKGERLKSVTAGKPDGWNNFYTALHIDMLQIFSESSREWVEGAQLMGTGTLHPICIIGDSHVLSAGWGYGDNWFSRPVYVPGLQIYQIATSFDNRSKSGLLNAVATFDKANHFVLSLGEIDYRLTTGRRIFSKQFYDPIEIINENELRTILLVEKERIYKALDFVAQCFSPGQKASLLSIYVPQRQRLESRGLSDEIIDLEVRFFVELNLILKETCEFFGLGFINSEVNATDLDWFADGIHKTHSFHRYWLEQYVSDWS